MGSLVALFVATLFYVLTLLSLGLLVSTKAQNQAFQMAMTVLLPSIFFSGFIFPRETMPWIFYAIRTLLPLTYFIDLIGGIVLCGATTAEFRQHLVIPAGRGVGF